MYVVALDPGVTTGWARYNEHSDERYKAGQIQNDEMWDLLETIKTFGTNLDFDSDLEDLTIVCEAFNYRRLPKAVLTPVEVIGVVKEWVRQNDAATLVMQNPAERMWYTDERLKSMGVYRVGLPHANDATRHLLKFLGALPQKGGGIIYRPSQ